MICKRQTTRSLHLCKNSVRLMLRSLAFKITRKFKGILLVWGGHWETGGSLTYTYPRLTSFWKLSRTLQPNSQRQWTSALPSSYAMIQTSHPSWKLLSPLKRKTSRCNFSKTTSGRYGQSPQSAKRIRRWSRYRQLARNSSRTVLSQRPLQSLLSNRL